MNLIKWFVGLFFMLNVLSLHGQNQNKFFELLQDTSDLADNDSVHGLLNYKSAVLTKGKNPDTLPWKIFPAILPGFGYSQLTGPTAVISSNLSTYLSNPKTTNLSSLFIAPEISLKKQYMVNMNANLWTEGNRWNILSDNRFYNYWINDYGLGKFTTKKDYNLVRYEYTKIHIQFNRQIRPNLFFGIGMNSEIHKSIHVSQTKGKLEAINITSSPIQKYTNSSGLELCFLYDNRINTNQPYAPGCYFHATLRQNLKWIGSTQNWTFIGIDYRKYIRVLPNSYRDVVLGFWCFGKFSLGRSIPYFDMPSTMWDESDNSGRPFIQGRFRGKQLLYFESELRFPILKNNFISGALFFNIQSFSNRSIAEFKQLIPAGGGSIRFLINKESKVNFVISYGVGYKWEKGFFFNVAEVF